VAHKKFLIIGYGSMLRGDDAAGPLAAQRLARRGFHALDVHQLTPELAEEVAAARTVIFLDAKAGLPPGEVSVEPLAPAAGSAPLEHHASPAGLMRLARTAYGAEPNAWLIGMGGKEFEMGGIVSPAALKAVGRAVEEVIRCTNRE
jgi:hydrogenase maturation protease